MEVISWWEVKNVYLEALRTWTFLCGAPQRHILDCVWALCIMLGHLLFENEPNLNNIQASFLICISERFCEAACFVQVCVVSCLGQVYGYVCAHPCAWIHPLCLFWRFVCLVTGWPDCLLCVLLVRRIDGRFRMNLKPAWINKSRVCRLTRCECTDVILRINMFLCRCGYADMMS